VCLDDVKAEIPIEIAKRGAYVGFDRVTIALVPDAEGHDDHGDHRSRLRVEDLAGVDFRMRAAKKNGGGGLVRPSPCSRRCC
jgi:hypothetical protein